MPGKACVITGGGGGMGRAAAIAFAKAGATLVGIDLDAKRGAETNGAGHCPSGKGDGI